MSERLDALDGLLMDMTDEELARAWARCMRQLRQRDLVRTANTPVGDYAERICCDQLGLSRMGFSEKSIDALDPEDGTRYQIKGRRLTPENPSRQLGAIRDIESKPFDYLLAVFFNEDLELQEIWKVPCEVVAEAKFIARTNSTRFVMTPAIQQDPRVTQLLGQPPQDAAEEPLGRQPAVSSGTMINHPAVLAEARRPYAGTKPQKRVVNGLTIVTYSRTRVYLDRDAWEMLPPDGVLLIRVRPRGRESFALAFTVPELEQTFGQVRLTRSWDEHRCYHFPTDPPPARTFRVGFPDM